jgi:hypothetical protein
VVERTKDEVDTNQQVVVSDINRLSSRIDELNSFMPLFIDSADELAGVVKRARELLEFSQRQADPRTAVGRSSVKGAPSGRVSCSARAGPRAPEPLPTRRA